MAVLFALPHSTLIFVRVLTTRLSSLGFSWAFIALLLATFARFLTSSRSLLSSLLCLWLFVFAFNQPAFSLVRCSMCPSSLLDASLQSLIHAPSIIKSHVQFPAHKISHSQSSHLNVLLTVPSLQFRFMINLVSDPSCIMLLLFFCYLF